MLLLSLDLATHLVLLLLLLNQKVRNDNFVLLALVPDPLGFLDLVLARLAPSLSQLHPLPLPFARENRPQFLNALLLFLLNCEPLMDFGVVLPNHLPQLFCPFSRLLDLLQRALLFHLQHPNPILQLLDIKLDPLPDALCLLQR